MGLELVQPQEFSHYFSLLLYNYYYKSIWIYKMLLWTWGKKINVLRNNENLNLTKPNESQNKDSPFTKWQWPSWRTDECIEIRTTVPEGEWTTSWPTSRSCEKEIGKLHYFFPLKGLGMIVLVLEISRGRTTEHNSLLFQKSKPLLTSSLLNNQSNITKSNLPQIIRK